MIDRERHPGVYKGTYNQCLNIIHLFVIYPEATFNSLELSSQAEMSNLANAPVIVVRAHFRIQFSTS